MEIIVGGYSRSSEESSSRVLGVEMKIFREIQRIFRRKKKTHKTNNFVIVCEREESR